MFLTSSLASHTPWAHKRSDRPIKLLKVRDDHLGNLNVLIVNQRNLIAKLFVDVIQGD